MIAAALAFIRSPLGRRWAAIAGVLIAFAVAISSVYFAGLSEGRAKVSADRDAWRSTSRSYLASAHAWERSFRSAEGRREQERLRAVGAVNVATSACDARVSAARRSAAAIQSIVTKEVHYDESRCPVRAVVGAGELRDALGLAAGR